MQRRGSLMISIRGCRALRSSSSRSFTPTRSDLTLRWTRRLYRDILAIRHHIQLSQIRWMVSRSLTRRRSSFRINLILPQLLWVPSGLRTPCWLVPHPCPNSSNSSSSREAWISRVREHLWVGWSRVSPNCIRMFRDSNLLPIPHLNNLWRLLNSSTLYQLPNSSSSSNSHLKPFTTSIIIQCRWTWVNSRTLSLITINPLLPADTLIILLYTVIREATSMVELGARPLQIQACSRWCWQASIVATRLAMQTMDGNRINVLILWLFRSTLTIQESQQQALNQVKPLAMEVAVEGLVPGARETSISSNSKGSFWLLNGR